MKIRKKPPYFKKIGITLLLLTAVPYIIVCLIPVLPVTFWPANLVALLFPLLFVMLLLVLLLFLIMRSKWWVAVLLLLLAGVGQLQVMFALHPGSTENDSNKPGLSVLYWNVARWDERNREKRGGQSYRDSMLAFVARQNADVLCFHEFFECLDPKYYPENVSVIRKLGYSHYYFRPIVSLFDSTFLYGMAIFSKHPILDTGFVPFPKSVHSEGVAYADIRVNEKRIRLVSSHLESTRISKRSLLTGYDDLYRKRLLQAEQLRTVLSTSPHPVILCANLSDPPNSLTYHYVRQDFDDAFLNMGWGLGRTYRFISPTLRIDYLLHDKRLKTISFDRSPVAYTEHYPLSASFSW